MSRHTPLYDRHTAAGGKMVDFGGWSMPLHYGSQMEEHHVVRRRAGVFDVSHMTVVDVTGADAKAYLRRLLANDVAKLQPGRALYGCMLNTHGGVIDDLITYLIAADEYRVVVNAATREKDLAWMKEQAEGFELAIDERPELAMLAVQGPEARELAAPCLPAALREAAMQLKPFGFVSGDDWFVARTGYTGEDGFEIVLPAEQADSLWSALSDQSVAPCGLGARDTLRLEAGLNLYGQDMDESTTPLESNLAWTVAWTDDREFIGREALAKQKATGVERKLVGLVLEDRGVLRPDQTVHAGDGQGKTTSGSYSPTLERAIALARLPTDAHGEVAVEIRGRHLAARIVKPPFVRQGQVCDNILD